MQGESLQQGKRMTGMPALAGRVAAQEGNLAKQLEYYRRALGFSNRNSLAGEARRDIIRKIFEIQYPLGNTARGGQD